MKHEGLGIGMPLAPLLCHVRPMNPSGSFASSPYAVSCPTSLISNQDQHTLRCTVGARDGARLRTALGLSRRCRCGICGKRLEISDVARTDHQYLHAHQRKGRGHAVGQPIKDHPCRVHHHDDPQETQSRPPPRVSYSLYDLVDICRLGGHVGAGDLPFLVLLTAREEHHRDHEVDARRRDRALDTGVREQADLEELSRHNDSRHRQQSRNGRHKAKHLHTLVPDEGRRTHGDDWQGRHEACQRARVIVALNKKPDEGEEEQADIEQKGRYQMGGEPGGLR